MLSSIRETGPRARGGGGGRGCGYRERDAEKMRYGRTVSDEYCGVTRVPRSIPVPARLIFVLIFFFFLIFDFDAQRKTRDDSPYSRRGLPSRGTAVGGIVRLVPAAVIWPDGPFGSFVFSNSPECRRFRISGTIDGISERFAKRPETFRRQRKMTQRQKMYRRSVRICKVSARPP